MTIELTDRERAFADTDAGRNAQLATHRLALRGLIRGSANDYAAAARASAARYARADLADAAGVMLPGSGTIAGMRDLASIARNVRG